MIASATMSGPTAPKISARTRSRREPAPNIVATTAGRTTAPVGEKVRPSARLDPARAPVPRWAAFRAPAAARKTHASASALPAYRSHPESTTAPPSATTTAKRAREQRRQERKRGGDGRAVQEPRDHRHIERRRLAEADGEDVDGP